MWVARWAKTLAERHAQALHRSPRVLTLLPGARVRQGGRELINFCSNDYLGLSLHPAVRAAFVAAADRYGVGAGASHLVTGHGPEHEALEQALAAFTGRDRALVFSTGWMANEGVIRALAGRHDLICQDRLNHASLLDGALATGAELWRYPHGDVAALAARLAEQGKTKPTLIVTDAVFSMDGDIADLPALVATARANEALLMIDDAHGFGILGPEGQGTAAAFGLSQDDVPVLIGTFGKALGTFGAFVAGSELLIDYLVQCARPYIYTTALPPAVAAATRASLEVLTREPERRAALQARIRQWREGAAQLGLTVLPSVTPIQPVILGSAERALRWSRALEAAGLLVAAIRPPTVPAATARLRITLTAEHSAADVERLLTALAALQREDPAVVGHAGA